MTKVVGYECSACHTPLKRPFPLLCPGCSKILFEKEAKRDV